MAVDKAVNAFCGTRVSSWEVAEQKGMGLGKFIGVSPCFDPPWGRLQRGQSLRQARWGVQDQDGEGDALAIARKQQSLGLRHNSSQMPESGDVNAARDNGGQLKSIEQAMACPKCFLNNKFILSHVLQNTRSFVGMTGEMV